jgi:hypothetical protein
MHIGALEMPVVSAVLHASKAVFFSVYLNNFKTIYHFFFSDYTAYVPEDSN